MAEGLTNWFCWVPFFEYECLNTHSFKDCDLKRYSVTCLNSQHCVTSSVKITSGTNNEGYVKGCASTCSASDQFQHATNSKSSVKLVDKCNGAPERAPTESPGGAPRGLPAGWNLGRVPVVPSWGAAGRALGRVSSPMVYGILLIATFIASLMYLFRC